MFEEYKTQNKPVECRDGFRMSVQASRSHYCEPQDDAGPYTAVEVGFPSEYEPLLRDYVDGSPSYIEEIPLDETGSWTDNVYSWVPVSVVLEVIEKHGGMVGGGLPRLKFKEVEDAQV